MRTHPYPIRLRSRVFSRVRVFRAYATCRDTLKLTAKQTRFLLKGAARQDDIADAEQLYNERSS